MGLGDVGGVNSIRSFTRSWQRAANFAEVIPQRPAFVLAGDQEPIGAHDTLHYGRGDVEAADAVPGRSLLRQHLEASSPEASAIQDDDTPSNSAASGLPRLAQQPSTTDFRERERKALDNELRRTFSTSSGTPPTSIFAIPPHLATPELSGSYGSYGRSYGTIQSEVTQSSMEHAADLWRQQQQQGGNVPDGEAEPILVKEVEQDGKIVLTVEGQSTLPQTIFNSIKYVPFPSRHT